MENTVPIVDQQGGGCSTRQVQQPQSCDPVLCHFGSWE